MVLSFELHSQMSVTYKVEVLPSPTSQIGEGPHWDADTQSLYFNDIYGRDASIHRFDYAENKTYSATIGECGFDRIS